MRRREFVTLVGGMGAWRGARGAFDRGARHRRIGFFPFKRVQTR
jgi:hypothetical protein